MVRRGRVRYGKVWQGKARYGLQFAVRIWRGLARFGEVRHGMAR